jgi:hypothetical protein
VIVTVAGPTAAVLDAVNVNVLAVVAVAGLNDAVTPAGRPLAVRATAPVKPPICVIEIAPLPLPPPGIRLTLPGEADSA